MDRGLCVNFFKGIKKKKKYWNENVFGDLERRRKNIVKDLDELDLKEEGEELNEEEVIQKKLIIEEFWRVATYNKSLCRPKS